MRNVASSIAESPPPTTAIVFSRKKKPSQVAHHETPWPERSLLLGEAELAVGRAGREDDRGRLVRRAAAELHALDRTVEVELDDVVVDDLGAEPLGLLLHLAHQVGALDALGEAGEVLDLGRVHQLAADLDRARDEQRLRSARGGVDRGGEARRTRTDDDDVAQRTSLGFSCVRHPHQRMPRHGEHSLGGGYSAGRSAMPACDDMRRPAAQRRLGAASAAGRAPDRRTRAARASAAARGRRSRAPP